MIRSFLTITLRILWRNKVTSFVNIFSLSIGITSFIFIMLYVHHETSFDKFHENYKDIYRLEADEFAKLPPVLGDYVKERLPEIKNIARLSTHEPRDITYRPDSNPEDFKFVRTQVFWADSTTFDVLTFPLVRGSAATALTDPFTAVITEKTAHILFGETDPIGKTIEFVDHKFEVRGVMKDMEKSHLNIGALISMTSMEKVYPDRDLNNTGPNSWLWSATYLLTSPGTDKIILEKKVNAVLAEINDGNLVNTIFKEFRLQPMSEIYFFGALQNLDYALHGSYRMVSVLSVIGVFMLVLASINYVNLTTARSVIRTKEVAVKRFVGSSVTTVRFQLILESVIVSVISLIVALTLIQIFIGRFNQLAMSNLNLVQWNYIEVWTIIITCTVLLGIVAGVYPSFYLTAMKPVKLIKGTAVEDRTSISPRSLLMTFQFTLSIVLTVCATTNLRQLNYLRHANLGFNKKQIIQLETPDSFEHEFQLRETFKDELLQLGHVNGVAFSPGTPGGFIPNAPVDVDGKKTPLDFMLVDHDYFDVMDIEIIEGQKFNPRRLKDFPPLQHRGPLPPGTMGVLVNETFVREFLTTSPLGHKFYREDKRGTRVYEIIGVLNDFHFRSLHHKITPIMFIQSLPMNIANIKVETSGLGVTIKDIEIVWKKVYGDRAFNYSFLDETFDRQYRSDKQLATVIILFTGIALIIACLGLFALSSFMISRRTKEIGIRKTMGASIKSIYAMLSWNFLRWIVLAVMLGCPIAWWLSRMWLNRFAYHTTLSIDIFIIAALVAFFIALFTVTWQALKAANANPIKSLRYE